MPFEGGQLQPSEIAALLHEAGFRDFDLVEMTATILGESKGYIRAYNDNEEINPKLKKGDRVLLPPKLVDGVFKSGPLHKVEWAHAASKVARLENGRKYQWHELRKVTSRDVGLGQINIPARDIGTRREAKLYDPKENIRAVRRLFDTRESLARRRRFNPWYAYTNGWATFPEWWVYRSKEAARASGKPREWVPTGRYLHAAIVGVANYYAETYGIRPEPLLQLPDPPPQPGKPPLGDGPRPVPNRGRGRGA